MLDSPPSPRVALPLGVDRDALSLTCHSPSAAMPWHSHDQPYLTLVLHGAYREHLADSCEEMRTGHLIVHPAGERHRNTFSTEGAMCLDVSGWALAAMTSHSAVHRMLASRVVLPGAPFRRITTLLGRFLGGRVTGDALLDAVSSDIAHRLSSLRTHRNRSAWLASVEQLIERQFREKISLRTLAAAVGCSPEHVARTYRRKHGVSIGVRVRFLRREWAVAQIVKTEDSLSRIAHAAGFADQAHFTRAIRSHAGATPSVLRRASSTLD